MIVWEYTPSEFAALLRELELIRRWRPRFNVQGQPHRRRRTYVCLGRRPAPYAFLSRRPPAGVLACFGPVLGGHQAREAVRRLNDWFRLRDCPQAQTMCFADQAELFPVVRAAGCLRYEIGTCLAPCAGACSSADYRAQVRAAQDFLAGTDRAALDQLEQDMNAAAEALAYERAGALRDKRAALQWLWHQLERLRAARARHTFVYPVEGTEGSSWWYLIRQGRVEAVVQAPADEASQRTAAAAVAAVFQTEPSRLRAGPAAEVDGVLLVAGWFRRYPEERARTLTPAEALACCRAGVSGPLSGLEIHEQQVNGQVGQQHRQPGHAQRPARKAPQKQRHQHQLDPQEDEHTDRPGRAHAQARVPEQVAGRHQDEEAVTAAGQVHLPAAQEGYRGHLGKAEAQRDEAAPHGWQQAQRDDEHEDE
jgi:excinuclease ABC subunit C